MTKIDLNLQWRTLASISISNLFEPFWAASCSLLGLSLSAILTLSSIDKGPKTKIQSGLSRFKSLYIVSHQCLPQKMLSNDGIGKSLLGGGPQWIWVPHVVKVCTKSKYLGVMAECYYSAFPKQKVKQNKLAKLKWTSLGGFEKWSNHYWRLTDKT